MRVQRFVEIDAPVERVFEMLSDFESFPRWMRNVSNVRRTGRRTSHWVAELPEDGVAEWDVEMTIFDPDLRLAWRSVGGDVDTDGEAVLSEGPRSTTLLRLVLSYFPTGGPHGPEVARLFGRDAEGRLQEDLEHFKRFVERSAGRERGRRETGERERHGEPRRAMTAAASSRHERGERSHTGRLVARPPEDERAARYRDRGEPDRRERSDGYDERRFNDALREARRSQTESMRRYEDERQRDVEHRRERGDDDWRNERTARAASRRDPGERRDDEGRVRRRVEGERDEEREYRPRYALTPRERERERAERGDDKGHERPERRDDREYSEYLRRRGVDRFLDDPPSRRWRR